VSETRGEGMVEADTGAYAQVVCASALAEATVYSRGTRERAGRKDHSFGSFWREFNWTAKTPE
jgi:hypothetical protein